MSSDFNWPDCGGLSGNPTGNESTEPGGAEHAETALGIRLLATSLVVYSQTAKDEAEFVRLAKATAYRILHWTEEGIGSSEKANGSAEKDAPKEVDRRKGSWYRAGLQLSFDLHCKRCHFQCWDCPQCGTFRCACFTCGCKLA